jgi:hypothetical protein
MVRHSVKPSSTSNSHLFSEAKEPTLTSKLFWVQVLAYRPLFLLGGLWFAMVCVSAIAYNRLMFTEPVVTSGAPLPRAELVSPSNPVSAAGSTSERVNLGAESETLADREAEAQLGTKVTVWGLLSLVGLCALGCLVISQQAKAMPRRAGRPQRRSRPEAKRSPPPKATGPKRLSPYSPQRDGVIVKGTAAVSETAAMGEDVRVDRSAPPSDLSMESLSVQSLTMEPRPGHRSVPQRSPLPDWLVEPSLRDEPSREGDQRRSIKMPLPPEPSSPQFALADQAMPQPHQPTVVPDDEDHPLDWSEASLAHTLDLRQRRSLSSWI